MSVGTAEHAVVPGLAITYCCNARRDPDARRIESVAASDLAEGALLLKLAKPVCVDGDPSSELNSNSESDLLKIQVAHTAAGSPRDATDPSRPAGEALFDFLAFGFYLGFRLRPADPQLVRTPIPRICNPRFFGLSVVPTTKKEI